MAIAWLYRGQYALADVKLATVVDPSGRAAGWLAVAGAAAVLPISLLPALRWGNWHYGIAAMLCGLIYFALFDQLPLWCPGGDRPCVVLVLALLSARDIVHHAGVAAAVVATGEGTTEGDSPIFVKRKLGHPRAIERSS